MVKKARTIRMNLAGVQPQVVPGNICILQRGIEIRLVYFVLSALNYIGTKNVLE